MSGLSFMFITLIIIGALSFSKTKSAQLAQGIILILSTLANEMSLGPVCYPIVSETPSGRLRYKTIAIGRFVYNLVSIFQNSVTPRMLSPTGEHPPLSRSVTWGQEADWSLSIFKLGIGAAKQDFSTPAQISSAIFGAGSAFQKLKTAPLVRSICSLSIGFQLGSSRVPKSTVSTSYVLLQSGYIRPLTRMMNRICSSIRLFGEVGSK